MSLGVRSWGNHHDGETVMLVGAYHSFGEIGDRLIRALPPVIRLTPDQWDGALVPILKTLQQQLRERLQPGQVGARPTRLQQLQQGLDKIGVVV